MQKKIKNKLILHIDIEKKWGGGQRQALLLIKNLNKKNNCLLCRKNSILEKKAKEEKIVIYTYTNLLYFSIFSLYKFRKFDIIHCHSSKSLTIGILLKLFFHQKLIYTKRVFNIHKNFFSILKLKSTDKIVAISKFVKKQLILNKVPPKKISIIYSSVDKKNIKIKKEKYNRYIKKNKYIIGSIGKLSDTKNHIVILKAVNELIKKRKDFIVYIIGDGKKKKKLEKYIKKYNLSNFVKLLGYRKDALYFFNIFDIFVFPSKKEGLGTSVIDSMLYKVPVIASSSPALPELIKNKKTGLLFDYNDYNKLAYNINLLLEDKNLRKKIIENAYKYAIANYSTSNMVNKYKRLYLTI